MIFIKSLSCLIPDRAITVAISDPSAKKEQPMDIDNQNNGSLEFDAIHSQRIGRASRLMIPRSINKSSI